MSKRLTAARKRRHRARMKVVSPAMFSRAELDLMRQWFNSVSDCNPAYLDVEGFRDTELYHKIMRLLNEGKT
ncbi:hypothetical protein ACN09C_18065 [Serratia fonticola]|uniref:hypothetical protein n=1 Tax=Serratia fonticola TaxID=47917 RepID=UPI003AFFBB8B